MDMVIAGDFLASVARQQSMPLWLIAVIGVAAAGLADRIPKVRNAKMWQRWLCAGLIGGAVGAIAWCVGYFVFNVDLS